MGWTVQDVSAWGSLVRQSLDSISPLHDVHEGYTRNLSYPSAQLPVTGGDDVTFVRCYALDETVVSVRAGMRTL